MTPTPAELRPEPIRRIGESAPTHAPRPAPRAVSRAWRLVAATGLLAACAAGRRPLGPEPVPATLTESQIAATHARSAYDALRALRADLLHVRGIGTPVAPDADELLVVVDGLPYGPVAALQTIPVGEVATLRVLRSWDAVTRYGGRARGGVVVVETRRGTRHAATGVAGAP